MAGRALGLHVMLGCMLESGLGIAAGAQMASLCDHVDLDGNLLLGTTPGPASCSRKVSNCPPNRLGSVSGKRYLILAEGKSGDARYGKTMRGVVAYSRIRRSPSSTPAA